MERKDRGKKPTSHFPQQELNQYIKLSGVRNEAQTHKHVQKYGRKCQKLTAMNFFREAGKGRTEVMYPLLEAR